MASKLKIGLIGDVGVGKTALLQRFCFGTYIDEYDATIGIETCDKSVNVDGKLYQLQLWDTAGQEKYHSLVRLYFKDIKGVLLVFQIDRQESFDHCKDWLDLFYGSISSGFTPPILLVGNKSDLIGTSTRVPKELIEKFVTENNIEYIETSSKANTNVQEAFSQLLKAIINLKPIFVDPGEDEVKITQTSEETDGGCFC
ncbi:GTP-binding protein yptV1, putative [Entamoeba invadens IP1]|uniref:GTP-binding protein yptV1, putative n=1 Tax=Entamoeba invadens IP1 TaxID=370355 RepID=A0A0A1U755_ENTIV|nr:GTP-binding protein yptV1, putative [Entamoeba invadens IP1]ELP88837.1 GTP-binding protein yptV1, putative [Entamoeba invadens IP1]|eukprot:XP_004255608.1 GTP-binding protein yptV1, putative [Entamoeba invadens IP1]